jgi:hypothetical protein
MPANRKSTYNDLLKINAALRNRIAELEHPPHYVPIKCAEARGYRPKPFGAGATPISSSIAGMVRGYWLIRMI